MKLENFFTEIELDSLRKRIKSEKAFIIINSDCFLTFGSKCRVRNTFLNIIKLIEFVESHEPELERAIDERLIAGIEILNLRKKTFNVLKNNNINTVGDLVKLSKYNLLNLSGFGITCLSDVNFKLKKIGFILLLD